MVKIFGDFITLGQLLKKKDYISSGSYSKLFLFENDVLVNDEKETRALHGLSRALIANMVQGVTQGFEKALEIVGVGYRAQKSGNKVVLAIGYSHPVEVLEDGGITFEVPTPNTIIVKGISKQQVGQIAADIRSIRPPEPYKGKGIKYKGEFIQRKVGKTGIK